MIGIIGAMEVEAAALTASLDHCQTEALGAVVYHRGILSGKEVVIARSGVGKVNAALTAQAMILRYSPTLILNTGAGGALAPSLKIWDAVVADQFVEHDMDTTPIGDPAGQLNIGEERLVMLPADPRANDALCRAIREQGMEPLVGTVASGDQFIATTEQKERIRKLFGAVTCEMEGAAIAHACRIHNVPCACLRVISDTADGSSRIDYPTFVSGAANLSATIVRTFLSLI